VVKIRLKTALAHGDASAVPAARTRSIPGQGVVPFERRDRRVRPTLSTVALTHIPDMK